MRPRCVSSWMREPPQVSIAPGAKEAQQAGKSAQQQLQLLGLGRSRLCGHVAGAFLLWWFRWVRMNSVLHNIVKSLVKIWVVLAGTESGTAPQQASVLVRDMFALPPFVSVPGPGQSRRRHISFFCFFASGFSGEHEHPRALWPGGTLRGRWSETDTRKVATAMQHFYDLFCFVSAPIQPAMSDDPAGLCTEDGARKRRPRSGAVTYARAARPPAVSLDTKLYGLLLCLMWFRKNYIRFCSLFGWKNI